jgi:hypothetical protein
MQGIVRALRPWWVAGAWLLWFVSSGCGAGDTAQPADPGQAQEALRAVLEAWKAGETPEDLSKRTPPIHVKDVDWTSGLHLVSYQAGETGQLVGYDLNYLVVLELKSPKGTSIKKNAVYTVTTRPELFVARQEG